MKSVLQRYEVEVWDNLPEVIDGGLIWDVVDFVFGPNTLVVLSDLYGRNDSGTWDT